jgi:hypothetical protein
MFKATVNGYIMPQPGTIEYMEARPASRGGGWILNLMVNGKSDTMVFANANVLAQTMMAMLNGAALAQMAAQPQMQREASVPMDISRVQPATQVPVPETKPAAESADQGQPKRKGRPPLTEAQKAERAAAKANGAAPVKKGKKVADIPAEAAQAA